MLDVLKKSGLGAGALAVTILIVLTIFHIYAERAVALAERVLARVPAKIGRPLLHLLGSFAQGLAVLKAPGSHLLIVGAQSLVLWLGIALSFYFNNLAFGITLPFHSTFLLIAFLTVGVAIPTPGSVGGFHAFYLFCLNGAFGVPQETAAAAGG
jgi:uncharacterized membrane protein YbhN (UPF0104 family)